MPIRRLTGGEGLHDHGCALGTTVLDYWRWANSDLIGNVSRGVLAEFLVSVAVGASSAPRDPWAPFDVVSAGGVTIEVKSAAYIQAWGQKALSRISFLTRATQNPAEPLGRGPFRAAEATFGCSPCCITRIKQQSIRLTLHSGLFGLCRRGG